PAKSPLTLSRLARGFLDYVKESNGEVDINTQDMRFAEYNRQLGWALQNSFRLNNRPLTLESDIRTSITLHLEINEKGSLEHCSLTPEIDSSLQNLLLKIVRGAYPMPPLPAHHTASNTLHIKIPIEIAACKGTHSYYFVFRGA
ncbi:MAG TPA: hypothetical protein VI522_04020, partial [Gammaproteobacteria bacterium]|nr:hypothetical protein [Gammaproteobacteria bacterium]